MKALIAGFTHSKGIAKQSGKPFDMMAVVALTPAGNVNKENFSKLGVGYEAVELPVAESAKSALLTLTYPCNAQLVIAHEVFAGRLQAVVSGVEHTIPLIEQPMKN
ncbi:hypothetical protein CXB49_09600 [Chromobacterium sp. ATCC 53434]|uniref:hypothetical protein n=1 Tax=Chromobacterium sp. (strain ATCC 53434 / SC 14030) TaxID=2059672 RepID=UPI000C75E0E8|nr:hypothetical protein [Chromobacterium sp. ATCC 53434]AUH51048.1 hypothetical protein CXB49_09600 [Chromobacterium sp. ATCC 53434]